jgi:hypothetical protein
MSRSLIAVESLESRCFLSAVPTPTHGGLNLNEVAQRPFTERVGTIRFKTVDQLLNAVIDWGDGTTSNGTLEGSYATGKYYVEASHAYAQAGIYRVVARTFGHLPGSQIQPTEPIAKFTSYVTVDALTSTKGGVTLSKPATKSFSARVGEFTYKAVDQELSAVINWGDGTTSHGKLIGSYATGEYYVKGTHTYAAAGTFKIDVKVYGRLIGGPAILPSSPLRHWLSLANVLAAG